MARAAQSTNVFWPDNELSRWILQKSSRAKTTVTWRWARFIRAKELQQARRPSGRISCRRMKRG